MSTKKSELLQLIQNAKIESAIQKFLAYAADDSDMQDELSLLSAQYTLNEKKNNRNTIAQSDYQLAWNKVSNALIALVKQWEEPADTPSSPTPDTSKSNTTIQHADKIYNIQHIDNANFS